MTGNPHVFRLAWCSRSRPAGRKMRGGLWWPPTVSNHVNEECVCPGEAKDVIEEEATCASLLWSPPLGHDTHGGSTTNRAFGRRQAIVMVRPRSSQSCEECQKSFVGTGKLCEMILRMTKVFLEPKLWSQKIKTHQGRVTTLCQERMLDVSEVARSVPVTCHTTWRTRQQLR